MLNTKKHNSRGFTLLEILLVVGIIAILAGIVIVAINPSKQLATVRNTERKSDIKTIYNAITQYYIDNSHYPASLTSVLTEVCDTDTATSSHSIDCTGMVDLSELVPKYLVAIPKDPKGPVTAFLNKIINTVHAATGGTGYYVMKDPTNKVILNTERAELGVVIAIGTTTGMVAEEVVERIPGSVYYNAAVDTSWDTVGNWWTDSYYSTPLGELPINGDTVYLDGQLDTPPNTPITASAIYAGSISESLWTGQSYGLNFSGVIGDATFTHYAYNIGDVNGNAIFEGNSCGANNQGTINGNAKFYYCDKNQGTINGNAEFYHNTLNDSGHITGDATFYGDSWNNGYFDYSAGYYVDGTATFYENSINGAAIETGIFHDSSRTRVSYVEFATFYDQSYNDNSVITNTAIFNDYSHNSYDITGAADFSGSSDMTAGTVSVCNFYESSTYSAGTGCTTCNGSVCPI